MQPFLQLSYCTCIKSCHLVKQSSEELKEITLDAPYITLLIVQFLLFGPSEYNSGMLEKLHNETKIHNKLPKSCYSIMRAHIFY